jgi:NAD(P)-dependent dehydrogenase (short-subunit alcohol dehydrogenase family)
MKKRIVSFCSTLVFTVAAVTTVAVVTPGVARAAPEDITYLLPAPPSDTPLWGATNLLAYVASKSAVIGMTRSLARELGADNITVNAVAPGLTLVEATEYVPQVRHQTYFERCAIQRDQLPEDVCGAVVFALSELSRFYTGQVMAVNGGFVMN